MANVVSRSRKRVSYNVLHNLSTADILYGNIKKKRRPHMKSTGFCAAKRVVASREDTEVRNINFPWQSKHFIIILVRNLLSVKFFKGTKYLVKWRGYSSFDNTWEPEEHLTQTLLR